MEMLSFYEWMTRNNLNTKQARRKLLEFVPALTEKPKSSEILYVAAILTRDAQESLWKSITSRVAIPTDWKAYCHHMTIRFKPTDDSQLPILGEDITLIVTNIFADDKGVAVSVEPNTNRRELHMPAEQKPHITVATAPGTPPVYSNELLRKGESMKMPQALPLEAFIGAKLLYGPIMPERGDAARESFT